MIAVSKGDGTEQESDVIMRTVVEPVVEPVVERIVGFSEEVPAPAEEVAENTVNLMARREWKRSGNMMITSDVFSKALKQSRDERSPLEPAPAAEAFAAQVPAVASEPVATAADTSSTADRPQPPTTRSRPLDNTEAAGARAAPTLETTIDEDDAESLRAALLGKMPQDLLDKLDLDALRLLHTNLTVVAPAAAASHLSAGGTVARASAATDLERAVQDGPPPTLTSSASVQGMEPPTALIKPTLTSSMSGLGGSLMGAGGSLMGAAYVAASPLKLFSFSQPADVPQAPPPSAEEAAVDSPERAAPPTQTRAR